MKNIKLLDIIYSDIMRYYKRSGGVFGVLLLLININLYYILILRIGNYIYGKKCLFPLFIVIYPLYFLLKIITNNDISIKADIGGGLYLGHIGGVVISRRAIIGENADISHQVTIGVSGSGENSGAPQIGRNVYIAPGAKVFGKIIIGDNVKIGANAVVYKDLESNSIVAIKNSMEVISMKGNKSQVK